MAEEQKKEEKKEPQSRTDKVFEGLEKWLDNSAEKGLGLGIAGDADMKKKIDRLGLDRIISGPTAVLERAILTPIKAYSGLYAASQYLGTRIRNSVVMRRRLAAEEYLKGTGPWSEKGLIYGHADRVVKEAPEYQKAYNNLDSVATKRNNFFDSKEKSIRVALDEAAASGNAAAVIAETANLRNIRRTRANIAHSVHVVTTTPPPHSDEDKENYALHMANTNLNTQRAAYLGTSRAIPNRVIRGFKQRRIERAIKHVNWKKELATKTTKSTFGVFRMSDYFDRRDDIHSEIALERKALKTASALKDQYAIQARIDKLERELKDMSGTMSMTDHIITFMHGKKAG